jgi:hypothetical protein
VGIDEKWFRKNLTSLKMTQRQVAKRLKIDPASLSNLIQGKRKLKNEEAAILASLFGVDVVEVLEMAGVKLTLSPKAHQCPVKGVVGEGWVVRWGKPKGPAKVALGEKLGPGVECLRVEAAGTSLEALDGALIAYRPCPGIDPESVGRLAIVTIAGGGGQTVVRILRRGYSSGQFNLATFSGSDAETGVGVEAAWPVLLLKM